MPNERDIKRQVAASKRLEELREATLPDVLKLTLTLADGEEVTFAGRDKEGFKWTNRLLDRACRGHLQAALNAYRAVLGDTSASLGNKVIVEVRDGRATVTHQPAGVEVEILNRD